MDNFLFNTIAQASEGELREKASRFFSYAYPLETDLQGTTFAEELWKLHPKATHVCYAYKIGLDNNQYRINDDGEPSGTAGKPIYGQILSKNLTDVGVYVVRYYGGTKLGASGLIAAYKDAAKLALDNATIIEKSLSQCYELVFSYDQMGQVLNELKSLNIPIISKNFEIDARVDIALKFADHELMIRKIKAALLNYSIDRINDETTIDFCTFEKKNIIKV